MIVGVATFITFGVNKRTKQLAFCATESLSYFQKVQPYIDWMKTTVNNEICLID